MDSEEDKFQKPSSPERRLRLRKNYNEKSTDNKIRHSDDSNNENEKNDIASSSQSFCEDDSILDFKSPKRIHSIQSKVVNNNRPPNKFKKKLQSKPKIIKNERNLKNNISLQRRRIAHDVQQPSIESSFFKSEKKETDSPQNLANIKTAYVCPLCLKNLKDENSQTAHMKSCAVRNNLSTKQLMVAMELQERQAAERKSLGLLSAPVLQDKRKPPPRKMATHDDPDLQLALALSKSLYEKEEMEEWDEAQIVAISSGSSLPDNNAEYPQRTTLQNFGFTSDRNIPPDNRAVNKIKRKGKLLEPTILQRRTTVERERILTERIAEILMDHKDFTQKSQEEEPCDDKRTIVIKNKLLQQLHRNENTLWNRTKLTSTQNAFYVEQLSPQITSLENKEQELNKEQDVAQLVEQNVNDEEFLNNEEVREVQILQDIKATDNDEKLIISSEVVNICCKEKKFLDSLATSWRNVLNDSSISDIIIFVRNSRHIWAHKLILYVRCPNVLLDIVSNDNTNFPTAKERLDWIDIDYDVALAFLEFIYCGIIDKHSSILDSDSSLSSVRSLARKYKVNDLFAYLRQKKFKSVPAEIKYDYNTCEKNIEDARTNMERTSSILKSEKSTFNASSNYRHDSLENVHCAQRISLQKNVDDNVSSLEDSYVSTKDSCLHQDKEVALIAQKLSEKLDSGNGTSISLEISSSPDMFDDTFEVTKHSDKFSAHAEDHDDSNIHMLLSLIKQDTDADICSQRLLTRKTRSAGCLESSKDMSACSKNLEQSVMEIDSDFESIDEKNSLIDNPQSSKLRCSQDRSSNMIKQKSDLSLFIERMQRENAKSDSDLDLDIECPVQISPVRFKNPFRVDKRDESKSQFYIDNEQSDDAKEKPGRLSVIEKRMRSYANKNPEFYLRLSNEQIENVKSTAHMSPDKTMKSSDYTKYFTSPNEKGADISKQIETTSTVVRSSCAETMNQSFNETISDLKVNEEELSMYSTYMKNRTDNSIAKYREAIVRDGSISDPSNKDTPDSSDVDETENDETASRSVLTQKDAEVIVSSDTETESISSNVSCRVVLQNCDDGNIVSRSVPQFRETIEQDIENVGNDQVEKIPRIATTNANEKRDINSATNSNRDTLDSRNTKIISDDVDSVVITQKRFGLSDDQEKRSIPSPIMVSSSPDFPDVETPSPDCPDIESRLPNMKYDKKDNESIADRKSTEFSFNFEEDIYLANVDVNKYERHTLEKCQSASVLNVTGFRRENAFRGVNKINDNNINGNNAMANDISYCGNLERNAVSLTQSSASVRKFQRKSLSEGQIDMNRLRNKGAPPTQVSVQSEVNCNHWQSVESKNAKFKVIDKDVTPPPDCDRMSTPELQEEMKKYGLKLQKRSRAVKLLTHIYNELHPLIPITEITAEQIAEISSDDEEEPPLKKRNLNYNSLEKPNDGDNESYSSQDSNESISSVKDTISKEMEFYETESLPALENSSDITEAFKRLINIDKDLHNKILRYEPVNIEQLRSTLQTHGFKCKLSNLMSFLDEQCITFYIPEQSVRSRTRKKA